MNKFEIMIKMIINSIFILALAVPGILLMLLGISSILSGMFELSLGSFLLGIVFIFLGGGWIVTIIDKIKE